MAFSKCMSLRFKQSITILKQNSNKHVEFSKMNERPKKFSKNNIECLDISIFELGTFSETSALADSVWYA